MADPAKQKTFSMVAAICSFVIGAFALVGAIYEITQGLQSFFGSADHHFAIGIIDLFKMVFYLGIAFVGIFLGLRLLAKSKLPASTNPTFSTWFILMAGLVEIGVTLNFVGGLIGGEVNVYWISRLIVKSFFLIGAIVMMLLSKDKEGLTSSIFFFIGVGCFLFASGYTHNGVNWFGALSGTAYLGFEVMAVLARVLEDHMGK
ncbi:MAG: hypothetical protein WCS90_05990 [Bacilli bacterium]